MENHNTQCISKYEIATKDWLLCEVVGAWLMCFFSYFSNPSPALVLLKQATNDRVAACDLNRDGFLLCGQRDAVVSASRRPSALGSSAIISPMDLWTVHGMDRIRAIEKPMVKPIYSEFSH
jgi:hypothetical protein